MQNGNDFYLIDIALAENSALKECVPKSLLKKVEEDWIPRINTNPHILELLKIIEKEWDKRFPLSFITNGRKLADTPDIFEAVQDMQKK